jgi:2-methylcitrate dehydratase PrpD
MKTISQRFAQFVTQLTFDGLSKTQIHKVKTYFLDWLGSAYAGQTQRPIKIMLEVVHSLGGKPESTLPRP